MSDSARDATLISSIRPTAAKRPPGNFSMNNNLPCEETGQAITYGHDGAETGYHAAFALPAQVGTHSMRILTLLAALSLACGLFGHSALAGSALAASPSDPRRPVEISYLGNAGWQIT